MTLTLSERNPDRCERMFVRAPRTLYNLLITMDADVGIETRRAEQLIICLRGTG